MITAEAVKALLEQRKDQGFDTPPKTVTERLGQLVAGITTTTETTDEPDST